MRQGGAELPWAVSDCRWRWCAQRASQRQRRVIGSLAVISACLLSACNREARTASTQQAGASVRGAGEMHARRDEPLTPPKKVEGRDAGNGTPPVLVEAPRRLDASCTGELLAGADLRLRIINHLSHPDAADESFPRITTAFRADGTVMSSAEAFHSVGRYWFAADQLCIRFERQGETCSRVRQLKPGLVNLETRYGDRMVCSRVKMLPLGGM